MNVMIMTFICKMLDNALGTLKNIYLTKEKYLVSSLFSAASTFFYMVAVVNTIKDSSFGSIIALCVATFLGSYIPAVIVKSKEDDKLYVFEVTSNTFDEGIELADSIKELNIAIKTVVSYDANTNKVLTCKIYCSTKAESIMVKEIIGEHKYHAYVAQDY